MKKVALMVFLLCAPVRAQEHPDARKGEIDGMQAMMVLPLPRSAKPDGCQVHLVPSADLNERFVRPCGTWFLPPAEGLYGVWVEDGGRVSESKTPVRYWPTPFRDAGFVAELSTVQAGFVTLEKDVRLREGETLRIASLTAPGYGFDRRARGADAYEPQAMPPGRTLAGIFDAKGDVIAFAPLVDLAAGKTVAIRPRKPVSGSDLFVILTKPSSRISDAGKTSLSVVIGETRRPPDAVHEVVGRFYALWLGLSGNEAKLIVESSAYEYAGPPIVLKAHEISTVRVDARLKR